MYGTLRPGCGNYEGLLKGKTISEETVQISGHEMWSAGGCPFVIKNDDPESTVTGTLIYVEDYLYDSIRKDLDSLEGYRGPGLNNWYERRSVEVETASGRKKAWVYVVEDETADHVRKQYQLVPHGDWFRHNEERISARRVWELL